MPETIPQRFDLNTSDWLRALRDENTWLEFPIFGHTRVDAKWGFPPRTLVEQLFYFLLQERVDVRIAGRTYIVMPGTLLWMPPNLRHQMWIPTGRPTFTLYWFRLRAFAVSKGKSVEIAPAMPSPGFVLAEDAWALRPFIQTVVEELRGRDEHHMERVRAAVVLLTSAALRHPQTRSAPSGAVLSRVQRERLRDYVARHVRERIEPAQLARELRLSHDYFSRVFRRSFGYSPKTWLMRERIQHAAQRLATSLQTVSEVAYEFGYRDVFLFSRQFKAVMGIGPKQWRARSGL